MKPGFGPVFQFRAAFSLSRSVDDLWMALNIVAGVALFHLIGFHGIAMATSMAAWLNVGLMLGTLARRGTYTPSAEAWSRIARIVLASAVLGAILGVASHYRDPFQALFHGFHIGYAVGPKELAILITTVAAALIYPPLLLASGGVTMADIRTALRRPAKIAAEDLPPALP